MAEEPRADALRISQYVDDAIELAEQIRQRYGVRKLILIGHSWGTVIGMHAALARPDLFHAQYRGGLRPARLHDAFAAAH